MRPETMNRGEDALLSIDKIIAYFMLEKVADGVVNQEKPRKTKIEECEKLGMAVANAKEENHGLTKRWNVMLN